MKSTCEQVHAANAEEHRLRSEILRDPSLADALKTEQAREKLRRTVPNIWSLEPEPISWVLRDLVACKAVTMIAGISGAKKTWLALQIAKSCSHGGDLLGRVCTQPRDVLYVDRENPRFSVRERLDMIEFLQTPLFHHWGLHCPAIPPMIDQAGTYIEIVRMFPIPPLLVFDTLIRFHTADENDARAMAVVMANFRSIAEAGAPILILHQQGKSGTNYRGSSELQAGVDVCYTLADREGAIHLDTTKNRLGPPIYLTLAFDVDEGTGFTVTDDPLAAKRNLDLQILADLLKQSPGLSGNEIENALKGRIGRNRVRDLLKDGDLVRVPGPNRAVRHYPPGWLFIER